jgi:hypothetical protein
MPQYVSEVAALSVREVSDFVNVSHLFPSMSTELKQADP